MAEPPFSVVLAGYCIDFHTRNKCAKCTDSDCPRLVAAEIRINTWRLARLEKVRNDRRNLFQR